MIINVSEDMPPFSESVDLLTPRPSLQTEGVGQGSVYKNNLPSDGYELTRLRKQQNN
jgi:hypothetical protein